jgi:hypothetical protein
MGHNLSHGRRRDWFYILRSLAKAGMGMAKVARKVGRNKTTVHAWAEGSEPKESDARVVLALFAKLCPREYAAHQQMYEIRVEIEATTEPGESQALPFVG